MIIILTKPHAEKFLRKLAGMTDLEDSLKKLDRLTQVVIDGARGSSSDSSQRLIPSNIYTFRHSESKSCAGIEIGLSTDRQPVNTAPTILALTC